MISRNRDWLGGKSVAVPDGWRRRAGIAGMLLLLLAAASGAARAETAFHVAPDGSDANPGTAGRPFATLERARDAIRALKQAGPLPGGGVTVWLHAGIYHRTTTFALGEQDSGTKGAPVVYRAVPGEAVRLSGGREVPASAWMPVTDPAILARLPEEGRGKVWQADLKALGLTDYGKMSARGFRRPYVNPGLELFFDGEAMALARWPNEGMARIGKVLDPGSVPRNGDYGNRGGKFVYEGDRPGRWAQADDLWISGLFNVGYADDTIKVASIDPAAKTISLAQATMYGIASGRPWQAFYALNLLEEIDRPGEWYLERKNGILYFYPPAPPAKGRATVSLLDGPVVAMEGASFVTLRDLVIEEARGIGVYIERGSDCLVAGCTLRNLGVVAVCIGQGIEPDKVYRHEMPEGKPVSRQLGSWHEYLYTHSTLNRQGGERHGVVGCDIYGIGAGAISLGGGDRKTLTPAGNYVLNCHIHDFNRLDRSYKAAVNVDGVGNRIAHNLIHDAPSSAIYVHGNDHVIEFNEIHHTLLTADDMGVIYMGRDPSEVGIEIRHNFFHHNGSTLGHTHVVYFDDGSSLNHVFGNVFWRNEASPFLINGGHEHRIENNLFLETTHLNISRGWDGARYAAEAKGALWTRRLREEIDITRPPYSTKYPRLPERLAPAEALRLGQDVLHNVAVHSPVSFDLPGSRCVDNLVLKEDARFVDEAGLDFTLRPDSPVFARLPGFEPIPFDRIGLYQDEYRRALPLQPPLLTPANGGLEPGRKVTMVARPRDAVIRYTLDGSEPTAASPRYTGPLAIARPTTVIARAFSPDGRQATPSVSQRFMVVDPADPVRCTVDGWLTGEQARELHGVARDLRGNITQCDNGDWASFGPFEFGEGRFDTVEAVVGVDPTLAGRKMHLRLDTPTGPTVATFVMKSTGSFHTYAPQSTEVRGLSGRHLLYLVFEGGSGVGNVAKLRFMDSAEKRRR